MIPSRFLSVSELVAQLPHIYPIMTPNGTQMVPFPQGELNDSFRLDFLKNVVIPALNHLDNGEWGLMTKTDQGNKIPCDILMWHSTREIVDVLTGTGATWIPLALPPPEWIWTAVSDPIPIPIPNPIPNPIPEPDPIMTKLLVIESILNMLIAREFPNYATSFPQIDGFPISTGTIVLKPVK